MPRCPVCYVPMTRIEEDGLRCHTCPSCFGHWMPATAMIRRLKVDVNAAMEKSPKVPVPTAPEAAAIPAEPPPLPDTIQATEQAPPPPPEEDSPLADLAAIVAESDSKKPVRCPDCEKFMHKDRFQQMIPVQVDRCKHCDRIWMDTGEYHLIRRLYVELSLSTDSQIVQLRDKVAFATVAWNNRTTLAESVAEQGNRLIRPHSDLASLTLDALFTMLTR